MNFKKLLVVFLLLFTSVSVHAGSSYHTRAGIDPSAALFPISAFGDLRTIELSPIFQGSFEYTVGNTEINTNTVVNGGTVTQADAMAVVASSTTTASTAELKTKRHAKYRAGFGGRLRFTFLVESGCVAGTEAYIGLGDETGSSAAFKNGLMTGCAGDAFGFHRFQNDVKFSVPQSSWNIDTMLDVDGDGAGDGPSGMILDITKINVAEIEFQYLGAGAITFYIENEFTGLFVPVTTIQYANNNTTPSMHNPNFHHTMFVDNGATTTDIVLKGASYAYFTEGKTELIELQQPHFSTDFQTKLTVTTEVAIFTIRNKAVYQSKTNFIDVQLEDVVASIEAAAANNLGEIRLTRNATLGGSPSYSDINTSDSVVEIDTSGITVTGGKPIFPMSLAGKNDSDDKNLIPYKLILAPGETLTISGTSANSATIKASILWKELF